MRTCLAEAVPAAHPWTTSIPAAWGRWGRQLSPPAMLSLPEGPNQRLMFMELHESSEMSHGRRGDLALVFPSTCS